MRSILLTDRQTERNYGIDALRLVAMFLVVNLHVLGHGGILQKVTGVQYATAYLLEIASYCAVNCYAIISGYVGYREQKITLHYAKYLKFWIPVAFYNVAITLIMFAIGVGNVSEMELVASIFPVTMARYWYVNAYTALFFLMPWLNEFLRKLQKKDLNKLVVVILMVFSVFSTASTVVSDTFSLKGGYSFGWLVILYIVGVWIKKNEIDKKGKTSVWIGILLVSIIMPWLWTIYSPVLNFMFMNYLSFTVVLEAISFVVIFSRMKLSSKGNAIVRIFSPAAFGVYLIHTQYLIFEHCIRDTFSGIANAPVGIMALEVLGAAGFVFVVCLAIEKVRLLLFDILKINRLISIVEKKLDIVWNTCVDKICEWI